MQSVSSPVQYCPQAGGIPVLYFNHPMPNEAHQSKTANYPVQSNTFHLFIITL